MCKLRKFFGIFIIVSLAIALVPSHVLAIPQVPMQFYGNVTIAGSPAADGVRVDIAILGTTYASTTVVDGQYGYDPVFAVPSDDSDTPAKEGGVDGDLLALYVGGAIVTTAKFSSGVTRELHLDVVSLPAPEVVVASPNGGESWAGGTEHVITWVTIDTDKSLVNIDYSTNSGSAWTPVVSGAPDTGSYAWTVPIANTSTARVRITAIDQTGNTGSDTSDTDFTIDSAAPSVSSVNASDIAQTSAVISWTTDEAATSRVDYGASTAYGSTASLGSDLNTGHSISLSGLSPDTTYHCRAVSQDASGNTAQSADSTFHTASGVATIVISDVAVSDITASNAVVTWTTYVVADSQVEYGLTTAYGMSTVLDANATTEHGASLNGLSAHTTYHYRVKSDGAVSDDYIFTTASESTPPVISEVAHPVVGLSTAVVTWSTDELANSQVVYDTSPHSSGVPGAYLSASPIATDLVLNHGIGLRALLPGTTYYYRAVSEDASGNQAVSAEGSFTTLADETGPTISGVSASRITTVSAVISWNTSEPATGQLFYDDSPHASGVPADYQWSSALNSVLLSAHSVGLAGVLPDTTFYYRVVSEDAASNESTSAEGSFTTLPDETPPTISGVAEINAATTNAIIVWVTDEDATTKIVYDTSSHTDIGDYASSAPLPDDATADSTSHGVVLSGLTPNVTYYYRVVCTDAYGNQTISRQHSFKTEDNTSPAVLEPAAVAISPTGAVIVWTTDEGATTRVEYGIVSATHGNYEHMTALDASLLASHGEVLTGLTSGTKYYYRAISQDASGNETISQEYSFVTT